MLNFSKYNEWLSERMFILVLTALILGAFIRIPNIDIKSLAVFLFAYMTFITALSTSLKQFVQTIKKPFVSIWILSLVHIVTPIIALCVGMTFYADDPSMRLGYLIGAAVPIGVTNIIWTSIVRGNVPVALVAVTLDTLIVPFFLPFYFQFIAGQSITIDYITMVKDLMLMVTIPSLLGMMICDITKGKSEVFSKSFGGFTSKIAFFLVIFINASAIVPQIVWNMAIAKTIFVTFIMVALGYTLGYLGSFLLKDRSREMALTMVYNVGMRNIVFGVVITMSYFTPATAVPIILGMLFQQPIAAMIAYFSKKNMGRGN